MGLFQQPANRVGREESMLGLLIPITRLRDFLVNRTGRETQLPHRESQNQAESRLAKRKRDAAQDHSYEDEDEKNKEHSLDLLA